MSSQIPIHFPAIIDDLDPMAKEPVRVLVTGAAGSFSFPRIFDF